MLLANTWITPLQVSLVICWLVYRWWNGRVDACDLPFWEVAWSALPSFFPISVRFAYESRNYPIHFEWVAERPPFLNWLVVMFPACLMWLTCLWAARTEPLARFTVIVGIGAMAGTYFFYMHDIYGGTFAWYSTRP